jgi:hypothetical protein
MKHAYKSEEILCIGLYNYPMKRFEWSMPIAGAINHFKPNNKMLLN